MTYGLRYTVPFRSLDETLYTVKIEPKGYKGKSVELIGGASPFVVNTPANDLLTPMRLSRATLSVYGSDYLQDLYASDPQGIRIRLFKGEEVEWTGFLLQDTFSQDFSNPEFIYEMECVCALSTLKYRKFTRKEGIVSFEDLIRDAIKESNGEYESFYVSDSYSTLSQGVYFARNLGVGVSNFYDELDKPMTHYEVLEELAKFLGMGVSTDKNEVYIIDYSSLSRDSFDRFNVKKNTVEGVKKKHSASVQDAKYTGTGAVLSRIPGKNKAKVVCSLYEVTSKLKEFSDKSAEVQEREEREITWKHLSIVERCKNPDYGYYRYSKNASLSSLSMVEWNDKEELGSCFCRKNMYVKAEKPKSFKLEPGVLTRRARAPMVDGPDGKYPKYRELDINFPILSIRSKDTIGYNSSVWFSIFFEWEMYSWDGYHYPAEFFHANNSTRKFPHVITARVSFRIGEYYFNGQKWAKKKSQFDVCKIEGDKKKEFLYVKYQVEDTNTFDKGVDGLKGYMIKSPDFPLQGDCELTIYDIQLEEKEKNGKLEVVKGGSYWYSWITNVSVQFQAQSKEGEEDKDSDLIYENVIDDGFVEEAETVDLKICTNPNNRMLHSSVYVDKSKYLGNVRRIIEGEDKFAEKHLIDKIISLYKRPRYQLTVPIRNIFYPYSVVTDKNLKGRKFAVAGGEEDYRHEIFNAELIELP